MTKTKIKIVVAAMVVASATFASASNVLARDFFSSFFNPAPSEPQIVMPLAPEVAGQERKRVEVYGGSYGSGSFCVRTCDGKYFPLPAGGQSKAQSCKSFCPASETRVFSGSSIDHAVSDTGRNYSSLPNAFKFRNEVVNNCTCNGKDSFGLAQVKIENDPTLRKGDMYATPKGLVVAGRSNESGRGSPNFTPVSRSANDRLPRVASQ